MSFTDEDLKRTKKELPEGLAGYGFDSMHSFSVDDLRSLLARLKAAEDVASHAKDAPITLLDAWKKAAGK